MWEEVSCSIDLEVHATYRYTPAGPDTRLPDGTIVPGDGSDIEGLRLYLRHEDTGGQIEITSYLDAKQLRAAADVLLDQADDAHACMRPCPQPLE